MKSDDSIPIPVTFVARRVSRIPTLCLKLWQTQFLVPQFAVPPFPPSWSSRRTGNHLP
jgi:hypothetical protein